MKIEDLSKKGLKKEFKVVVEAAEIAKNVEKQLKEVSKTAKVQGFRKGKVPMNILKQKYLQSVMGEVLEISVQEGVDELLKQNKLTPAYQPDVKITSFAEDKDLEFDVNFEVLPEIKIEAFDKISLTKLEADVDEEEVNKTLEYLASSRRSTAKISEDRETKKGDIAVIDFVGSVDGVEFEGGKGSDYKLELGSNSFIPGFEDQLIGKKAGEKVDVNVEFPKEYHAKDLAGKPSLFVVDIKEIHEVTPTVVDEEFAKSMGASSLEEIKTSIKEKIKADYDNVTKTKLKKTLLDAMDKQYSFELPEKLVDMEFDGIKQQYEAAKKNNQLSEDEKSKKEEDLLAEYKELAVRRVRLGLVLSEIGKDAKVEIKPEDINKAILEEARRYPGQEQMVFDYYLKNKQAVEALRALIFEEKIIDSILEKCKVDTKVVSIKELMAFDEETPEEKKSKTKKAEK
ncbi:MAG: trigger factor [Alphaproteobacteria bacterium]